MGAATTAWVRARRQRRPLDPWPPLLLVALALAVSRPGAAGAQGAEVVPPDPQGDFRGLERQGPRGPIRQLHWLVVDPDPAGLACRDAAGQATVSLRPGAIVATDPTPPQALRLVQGRPWLRVLAPPLAIQRDTRPQERGRPARCWVRAHRAYLAPVLPEFLQTPTAKTH